MRAILVGSIFAIAGIFVLLTLVIVANKAWRDERDRRRRRRRRVIEPRVQQYAAGRHASLGDALSGFAVKSDGSVLEELLLEHARDGEGRANGRVGQALEESGAIDRWLRGLDSASWWKRADSAEKLGRAGVTRAVPALTHAMEDEVAEVRLRAAQALGQLGTGSALRPLVGALCEPNRWFTIRIAEILTARGDEVVDEIEESFHELTPKGKLAALDVLADLRASRAAGWLISRLADDDPDVRARAAHALGAIGDPRAGTALVHRLQDDEWPPRAMAARALGRLRHEAAIDPLTEALRDPEWWVRTNAAEALRAMGPAGLDALRRMLADDDTYARHQAILMLQEAGVLDVEVGHLASADTEKRARARELVLALVDAGQLDRLRGLSEEHSDPKVRAALAALVPEPPEARS